MYLPIALTLVIPIGAFLGLAYDRWADRSKEPERRKRFGILLATGLIVGESLFGVAFAGVVAATGEESPLGIVGEGFVHWAEALGVIAFVLVVGWLYRFTQRTATSVEENRGA